MVESKNKSVDLTIKGRFLNGLTSDGNIMVGDKAFEYYNEKNIKDYIQIPYKEISYISASVIFKKKITRFAIHTRSSGYFIFTTTDNKKTLRAINKYLDSDKLRRSLSFFEVIKRGIKNLINKRETVVK
ncbi:DUF956 family protein [Anaerococcus sp. AGMB00486]|uniref:DUF956 family protein n=2 Tax=Anaerococcus TaxID=165779 RepID=A0ABX2NCZ0_9FIRM|nr:MULTISPECIES: DUF956 family protein [Anaerococcus]MDY3005558.1 DUF956 family protein [Anaerococcus porci]MSS78596.1 DUF956 family protein [Anaerococcus porci]NVF12525.1 DUF956 family protein [Anaerococcus faecalis]